MQRDYWVASTATTDRSSDIEPALLQRHRRYVYVVCVLFALFVACVCGCVSVVRTTTVQLCVIISMDVLLCVLSTVMIISLR